MSAAPCVRRATNRPAWHGSSDTICMDGSTKSACPPGRKESTAATEPARGARAPAAHWHERRMTACFPSVFQGEDVLDEEIRKGEEVPDEHKHKAEELPAYQLRHRGDRAMEVIVVGGTLAGLVAEVLLLATLIVAFVERHDT